MQFTADEILPAKPEARWDDIVREAEPLQRAGWVFRAIGTWTEDLNRIPIESSFDVAWKRRVAADGDRRLYEVWMLADFKREALNHLGHVPEPTNLLEWMAIGRHYGMPSRLVDFTYSFFVAAYFALSLRTENEHASIVALNLARMKDNWERKLASEYPGFRGEKASFHNHELFREFAFTRRDHYAAVVNPLRKNPRHARQMGCFLCPGNIDTTADENLTTTLGSGRDMKKLICLRRCLKTDAMLALRGMNISQATLYPDLVGWAESQRDLVHQEITDPRLKEELAIAISEPRI
jgi:FRG domain